MAIKLGLLSGKGGSGKTTLGLTIASFLNSMGLKILLIDCDMATNGASYFFEKKYHSSLLTLNSIRKGIIEGKELLQIKYNFDFIPTIIHAPYKRNSSMEKEEYFINYVNEIDENYDVIIFDCQAGYSENMESILSLTNTNLIVMEPDAISSSAVRVLYSQIAEYLETKSTYQIFNKISAEEKAKYANISMGTMFTALPPLSFNWDIRECFAYSRVPEADISNLEFFLTVYDIVKVIIGEYREDLINEDYITKLVAPHQKVLESELTYRRRQRTKAIGRWRNKISITNYIAVGAIVVAACGIISNFVFVNSELQIINIALIFCYLVITAILFNMGKKELLSEMNSQEEEMRKNIKEIEDDIKILMKYRKKI